MKQTDYSSVTELPGKGVTKEQLKMAYTRYNLASKLSVNKDVLELACGSGIGLGMLSEKARSVIGADIDNGQIIRGKQYYGDRVELVQIDAEAMPFEAQSFDLIILLEAVYYIENLIGFIDNVNQLLRPGGVFYLTYPNIMWHNFNPSPFTFKYPSAAEMDKILSAKGFSVTTFVSFKEFSDSKKSHLLSLLRGFAVKYKLIPKSFAFKNILKAIFVGKLQPLPFELGKENDFEIDELVKIDPSEDCYHDYRVIYTVATKQL